MPYCKDEQRRDAYFGSGITITDGMLNYMLTNLVLQYIEQHGLRYSVLNSVVGVLECIKMEIYRRIGGVYEDQKIKENGDVMLYEQITRDNGLLAEVPTSCGEHKGSCRCVSHISTPRAESQGEAKEI